jgi:SAM-dependent methyltransferase
MNSVKRLIRSVAHAPGLRHLLFARAVQQRLQRVPGASLIYGRGWELLHPFDLQHGTETSGYVPPEELPGSVHGSTKLHVYGGSQPSIIRAALATLPALPSFTFIDLGCGKGRPLLVASEFPFRAAIGVELSAALAQSARRNLELYVRNVVPDCDLKVEVGDAAAFNFPAGDLCVFLYNPFGAEVMQRVVSNLEHILQNEARRVFVVYYNPVHGACWDASPFFSRYFAGTIPYAAEEIGFGPDEADPVVIWQAGRPLLAPRPGAESRIIVTTPDYRCALVAS